MDAVDDPIHKGHSQGSHVANACIAEGAEEQVEVLSALSGGLAWELEVVLGLKNSRSLLVDEAAGLDEGKHMRLNRLAIPLAYFNADGDSIAIILSQACLSRTLTATARY